MNADVMNKKKLGELNYQEQTRLSNENAKKMMAQNWDNTKQSFNNTMTGAWRGFQEAARAPTGEVENNLHLVGKSATPIPTAASQTPPSTNNIDKDGKKKPIVTATNPNGFYMPPRQTSYHLDYGNKPKVSAQNPQPAQVIPTGGIPTSNQNYADLVKQLQQQEQTLKTPQTNLGLPARTPKRSQENQQQREELLRQATTVHKGAHGLTANQLRLAHELTNDDIKLAQERYMQQNNLNHQLQQEQLQQQAQNARTLAGEQGAMARTAMNEQGVNQRFNKGFGLDMARFNQDVANKQHEFGLRGMELNAKLKSQSYDDAVKQELNSLYHNYGLAQTDEEKQALYDKLGFLTGKGGQKENPKDYLMTVSGGESKAFGSDDIVKNPDRIIDTRTMKAVDIGQADASKFNVNDPNHQAHLMELVKKETSVEGRKKLLMEQMGLSEEEAQIAIQNAMGAK